jgi:membrane protein involved in colicin uptake
MSAIVEFLGGRIGLAAFVVGVAIGAWTAWWIQDVRTKALRNEHEAYRLEVGRVALDAEKAVREREEKWKKEKENAEKEAVEHLEKARADNAAAAAAADRLRNDIAAMRARHRAAVTAACPLPVPAVGDLLGECAEAYRGMAAKADGHAGDVRTLIEGWPK